MTRICCECRKVDLGNIWFSGYRPLTGEQVTHVYCPECYAGMMARIEQLRVELKDADRSRPCRGS